MKHNGLKIGLISDTHGLLRPEAVDILRGSDHIIHAGDIGKPAVLEALSAIAPLTAIRGNVDVGTWADTLPWFATIDIGGIKIHVVHNIAELNFDVAASGVRVVVSGHSHQPRIIEKDGVLFVNSGSAGPRRFSLPISIGRLIIRDGENHAELIELSPGKGSWSRAD